ncbi:MAG: hypothetical protein RMX35_25770 [Nostoc sp. DcaGUA01]|nr:hypothetical protein [Nostoc sp. DcaGUA01]
MVNFWRIYPHQGARFFRVGLHLLADAELKLLAKAVMSALLGEYDV